MGFADVLVRTYLKEMNLPNSSMDMYTVSDTFLRALNVLIHLILIAILGGSLLLSSSFPDEERGREESVDCLLSQRWQEICQPGWRVHTVKEDTVLPL